MLLWLISNACTVRATYSFLYVDHGLSQSLRFLPKGSQALGLRLGCVEIQEQKQWVKFQPTVSSLLLSVSPMSPLAKPPQIKSV